MTPGRNLPTAQVQTGLLHESEQTRVTRLVSATGSTILKEGRGHGALRRLRHEAEILERLSGVEGVVQLAPGASTAGDAILLADVGGEALSEVATPLDPPDLVHLAGLLARAVQGMHRRGVVHRDINPANILLTRDRGALYLSDFALASTLAAVRPGFNHHNEIVGTVPYLAPEQTGRTGRPADQRADLYAVGATLYELATGAPPFGSGDPVRIIHDHLARVPARPLAVNPSVPASLSKIIMHLLEKEPDDRYQSAAGLAHDLDLLRRGLAVPRPGSNDLPERPLMPSRLAGRDREISELSSAFDEATAGRSRGVLVGGPPGVGKTSLVNELRPVGAKADGWFVAGKFDQYRRDQEHDGVRQALRALGRLLLAEPEDRLVELRERLLLALGANAGLASAVLPELAVLLDVPPEPGDPMTAQVRAQRTAADILRAVASRNRPVVFFVDDLQWAGRTPLGFVDLIFGGEEQIDGLLLVGAYRDSDVDVPRPLPAMLGRWSHQPDGPRHLRLRNLASAGQEALVADVLRLDPGRAAGLARTIAAATAGNPYDTVELLDALRHDGGLALGDCGWQWDEAALRRRLQRVDVTELLAARVAALPAATQEVLAATACLAGQVELEVLAAATGLPEDTLEQQLAPALAEGLMVLESGGLPVVRFHHDRARESVLGVLTAPQRRAQRLSLARRLAGRTEFLAVAAEQYLLVVDAVHDAEERQLVAGLFRRAADEAALLSNYSLVERLLGAAAVLVDQIDTDQLIAIHAGRHAALYSLGRLDDADEAYQTVDRLCTNPAQRTDATVVQVASLTNRGRASEAMRLGLDQLRQLGLAVPRREDLDADVERGLDAVYQWIERTTESDDLARPRITDRSKLGAIKLVNRLMPAAFFSDQAMMVAWLTVKTLELWARHGPDPVLVGPASHAAYVTTARRHDYRTGYRVVRRILAVGKARGFEPDVWQAQFLYVLSSGHWFEPLEDNVAEARRALEGLLHSGDLLDACWTHYVLLYNLLDCAPSLDVVAVEVEQALAIAARTGNGHAEQMFRVCQHLVRVLRGEAVESAADEAAQLSTLADDPTGVVHLHVTKALAAAVLDRPDDLARHAAAATLLGPTIEANYAVALSRVLRALALAAQVRAAPAASRAELAELDELVEWLAARAADAPVNFGHLLRLVEAERAWAAGNFHEAAYTFDVAQREAAARARPWHRALVVERAARFYLAHGMEEGGYALLAAARCHYDAWGARAKVSQLDWAHPTLRSEQAARRPTVTTGTIDLLGVVAASQALSSETGIDRLRARVVAILSAMTGATRVHLLLRDQGESSWLVPVGDGGTVSLAEAGWRGLLPPSVVWYAERTNEPVVVADVTRDERFRRDPYFADLDRCSLLAVPIMIGGAQRAMLLLENRLIRGAFAADRLEGIMLIAGQLAVSLDNALVYASLERKVTERTQQLAAANRRLEQLSVTDPLTGLANRRRLEVVLDAEWHRAQQQAAPVALAMIDIDHFKLYNDHFGHAAGDRCLQRVAACLAEDIGDTRLAARYGGEEFAVVMPGTDVATAAQTARRLCAAVVELAEPHPLVVDQIITVSIGVAAVVPTAGDQVAAFVELADVELYRAKRAGRNRVEVALPRPS